MAFPCDRRSTKYEPPISRRFVAALEAFMQQKQAVGFPYQAGTLILRRFDRFCVAHYPDVSREVVPSCAARHPAEHVNTLTRQVTRPRQFARYLNGQGIPAYALRPDVPGRQVRYVPHIYTAAEWAALSGRGRPPGRSPQPAVPLGGARPLSGRVLLWFVGE
jgi:hypothetical protein